MFAFRRAKDSSWGLTAPAARGGSARRVPDWALVTLIVSSLLTLMGALVVFLVWVISARL